MSQNQAWITLDSIIKDYLIASEQSNNKYFKLFHAGFRCMEDLGLDFFYQIKSVKLPINANKTVTLPNDYLKYTKLGILNGIGEIVPLKYNEKLTTLSALSLNRIQDTSASNFANYYSASSPVFFNFWNGTNYSNLYGVSSSGIYNGGFKIDEANGVIILDAGFNWDGLVLEYVSSPEQDQEYYVPVQFREAIVSWLAWQDIIHAPTARRGSLGDKDRRRHEYFESRRRGIGKYKPFYLDQAYIATQDAARLVVKA